MARMALTLVLLATLAGCRNGGDGDADADADVDADGFISCDGGYECPRFTECCTIDDHGTPGCCTTGQGGCTDDEAAFCDENPGGYTSCSPNEAGRMRCDVDDDGECVIVFEPCGGTLCQVEGGEPVCQ